MQTSGPAVAITIVDGWIVRTWTQPWEDAINPADDGSPFGTIIRRSRQKPLAYLDGLPFTVAGAPDFTGVTAELRQGITDPFAPAAVAAFRCLAANCLPASSRWHGEGDALLAQLRLGGMGDEHSGRNKLARAKEQFHSGLALAETSIGNAPLSPETPFEAAIYSRWLNLLGTSRYAVRMHCRDRDSASEKGWAPSGMLLDAFDTGTPADGLWVPSAGLARSYVRTEETGVGSPRALALEAAAECGVLYSAYITGDLMEVAASLHRPYREEDGATSTDVGRYPPSTAIRCVKRFVGNGAEHLISAARADVVIDLIATAPRSKSTRPSRRAHDLATS